MQYEDRLASDNKIMTLRDILNAYHHLITCDNQIITTYLSLKNSIVERQQERL